MIRDIGFTLLELLIVILIMGIMASIAVPALTSRVNSAKVEKAANDFIKDLRLARSNAKRNRVETTLCASTNSTECTGVKFKAGWIVKGASVLAIQQELDDKVTVSDKDLAATAATVEIKFQRTGFISGTARKFDFSVIDKHICVSVSKAGNPSYKKAKCT